MGKIIAGIAGPFSGKVGPVVGCTWKGIPYMRSLPKKRTGEPSKAEKSNRKRFAFAHVWLMPLLPFVRQGFKGYSPTVEGFLAAKSYLLLHAIAGEYPDYQVLPEKMKVSHGDLPFPASAAAVFDGATGQIIFSWDPAEVKGSSNRDQAMLLAYCTELAEIASVNTASFRENGTDVLEIPEHFAGKKVEVYLAFVAADRSRQSDSQYLGSILCEG